MISEMKDEEVKEDKSSCLWIVAGFSSLQHFRVVFIGDFIYNWM